MAKSAGKPKAVKRPGASKTVRRKPPSFLRRIGFRAGGGAVTAGQPYVVGERGAELFVPQMPGRIQTIPGGLGRAASTSRAPGRGFAALAPKPRFGKVTKTVLMGVLVGGGAFALAEVLDRAGVNSAIQGGIFAGIAIGLAAFGQVVAAAGVAAISLYELGAAGWAWFKDKYPNVASSIPGVGGAAAPAQTRAPAAA